MDPSSRSLIRITLPEQNEERFAVKELVGRLMGKNPEHRFHFIQNYASDVDRNLIDA
jgi:topoisomerase-4 subunit B